MLNSQSRSMDQGSRNYLLHSLVITAHYIEGEPGENHNLTQQQNYSLVITAHYIEG